VFTKGDVKTDDKDSSVTTNGITSDNYSTAKPVVKDIACVLLQLQQSVEQKFLNRPLVGKSMFELAFNTKSNLTLVYFIFYLLECNFGRKRR